MTTVRNLDAPDDVRKTYHGRMDLVTLDGATIVRATFEPGWRWSTDVKRAAGTDSCQVAQRGRAPVELASAPTTGRRPSLARATRIPSLLGDAWVVGDEPAVLLDVRLATGGPHATCPCGVGFPCDRR